MACDRTLFTKYVTRITAAWLNKVDAVVVALGCSTTKQEVIDHLDVMTTTEIQALFNAQQSQINQLNARIEALEACLPDGYCFEVVTALPVTPNPGIIYYVTG
jgi:hypothetical protein